MFLIFVVWVVFASRYRGLQFLFLIHRIKNSAKRTETEAFTTTHEFLKIKPIEQLVPVSSTPRSASTPGLSTS